MAKPSKPSIQATDPIRFEVVRNALAFETNMMGVTLRRSAFSTNIKTRGDFSCAFFDNDFRSVAQSFDQPGHLTSLSKLVPWAVKEYGVGNLEPGDALMVNDPFNGGGHLNDITLISPVHLTNELVGYVANLAHHVDVGGGAPASIGAFRVIYQEGVQIPPVKLVSRGTIDRNVFNLFRAQIRAKREVPGDLRAQLAANHTGASRIAALYERVGKAEILANINELISYSERRTKAGISDLPNGRCHAVGYMDDDGYSDGPVRIEVGIEIDGGSISFDLTGSDPQRDAPANSTYAQTFAACAYAVACLIDHDIPVNHGFYQAIHVHAPAGTVMNATHPAPVVAGWELAARLGDVLFKALSELVPKKVPAGTKGMICHAGFGGMDPRRGEYYCDLETVSGGYGGRYGKDGPDAVQMHMQNTENAPIEETEYAYPVRINRYELVPDSEGAGRWRGGMGVRRDYCFPDQEATFTVLADRVSQRPWGLFGGDEGAPAAYTLYRDEIPKTLPSKVTVTAIPGDVISYRTCGGGGYGNPLERDPQAVVEDVREDLIDITRARDIYGVVVEDGAIDRKEWTWARDATQALRRAHSKVSVDGRL